MFLVLITKKVQFPATTIGKKILRLSKVRETEKNHWVEDKLFPTQLQ